MVGAKLRAGQLHSRIEAIDAVGEPAIAHGMGVRIEQDDRIVARTPSAVLGRLTVPVPAAPLPPFHDATSGWRASHCSVPSRLPRSTATIS